MKTSGGYLVVNPDAAEGDDLYINVCRDITPEATGEFVHYNK